LAAQPSRGREAPCQDPSRGRYINARPNEAPRSLAVDATIRKAVRESASLRIQPAHLMEKIRKARSEGLCILALDLSSSMRLERKIRLAKTLTWQFLQQSYEKKNRVALVCFRGAGAQVVVEPTRDHGAVDEALDHAPSGGKTPLTAALLQALELAGNERNAAVTIVLISDGKPTVFQTGTLTGDLSLLAAQKNDAHLICVNTERRSRSMGFLEELAARMSAEHCFLEDLL
jgi:magnesium chelatase subunit D